MNLTVKEQGLLKDLLDSEALCRDKYKKHSEAAVDPQLKNLFSELSGVEAHHYDVLNQLNGGTVPTLNGGSGGSQTFNANYTCTQTPDKENDCYLCSDALAMEKHVSHVYDTCVFEFEDENARCLLSKIQDAEQEHGKKLYDYMKTNCMYG